jgi:hypothetical protein
MHHPSDDELEAYVLDRVDELDVATIEEHYLACAYCVGRLEALTELIAFLSDQAGPPSPRDF